MTTLIGVFNTPPLYVMGLIGTLEGTGYSLEEVAEPRSWLRHHRGCAVLIGVHEADDFDVVVELRADGPGSVVVTLLGEICIETVQASLRSGATAWVALNARPDEVVLTFQAAMSDLALIPAPLARVMASETNPASLPASIQDAELAWMRALAAGESVADLGRRLGYSEREMYRRFRRLYSRIGANGRTDALIRLARWGLLD